MAKDKDTSKKDQNTKAFLPPSGFKIIVRKVWRDKVAFASFCVIVAILLFTFVGSLFLNKSQITEINITETYYGWGESDHILDADDGGRDVLKLLMMGGRNSILVGLSVTALCGGVGLLAGLFSGYFSGATDAVIMHIIDFIQVLPQFPIIITLTIVIPNYNAGILVLLVSMFGWISTTRYFRAFVLSQREYGYVLASKTFDSSNLTIIFREVLPNITSALAIDVVLMIAGNIGIETTLSSLGYGLPTTAPSLGTLIRFTNDPVDVTARPWLWIPATFLLLITSLSINYVGRTLQRAEDARQREN